MTMSSLPVSPAVRSSLCLNVFVGWFQQLGLLSSTGWVVFLPRQVDPSDLVAACKPDLLMIPPSNLVLPSNPFIEILTALDSLNHCSSSLYSTLRRIAFARLPHPLLVRWMGRTSDSLKNELNRITCRSSTI